MAHLIPVSLALLIFVLSTGSVEGVDHVSAERLRSDLLQAYDKHSLPADSTTVKFRITIKHFQMIEESQSLMVDSWIVNEWVDPRLKWDPAEYHGTSKISVPHHLLWKPDLDVYNSARIGDPISYGNTLLIVFYDGRVLFVPAVQLHFTCVMDLTLWPHDTHNCTVVIGSWIHDGFDIDLQIMDDKPEIDIPYRLTEDGLNLTRGWWDLVDSNITRYVKYYNCCVEPYVTIKISMMVTRNAPAYAWTVKLPAIGLSILTMVLFLLPPSAGEKILFGGLCLILDVLFIAYTSSVVSHAPSHTPLIVELVSEQVLLVVVSIVLAAVSVRFARDPHTTGLPPCMKRTLMLLATCLCLGSYKTLVGVTLWEVSRSRQRYSRSLKSDELEMGENGTAHLYTNEVSSSSGYDWLLMAAVMDRVCLVVFLVIFIVNMLNFSAVL